MKEVEFFGFFAFFGAFEVYPKKAHESAKE